MQPSLLSDWLRDLDVHESVVDPTTGLSVDRYVVRSESAESGAVFAHYLDQPVRTYRLLLWREWDKAAPAALFVGMNPSTADERRDDPTCRKEQLWAASWGHGRYVKTNIGSIVSTDPDGMRGKPELEWAMRRRYIVEQARLAGAVYCCWGTHPLTHVHGEPVDLVRALIAAGQREKLHVLRLSKDGHPWHPLYLPNSTLPSPWVSPYGL